MDQPIFDGEDSEEIKKERMKYLYEIYWTKLGNVITPNTFDVWKALYSALSEYHNLLFERKKLVNEAKNAYASNTELAELLDIYRKNPVKR